MRTSDSFFDSSHDRGHRFPRDVLRPGRRRAEGRRQRRGRGDGRAQVTRGSRPRLSSLACAALLQAAGVRAVGAIRRRRASRSASACSGSGQQPLGAQTRARRRPAPAARCRCSARRASWPARPASTAASASGRRARWSRKPRRRTSKPQLRIAISGDAEGAAPVTATETIQQFTIGGERAVVRPQPPLVAAPRAVRARPAAAICASCTSRRRSSRPDSFYQFGGGVDVPAGARGGTSTRRASARAPTCARSSARRGVAFDGGSHTSPAAGAVRVRALLASHADPCRRGFRCVTVAIPMPAPAIEFRDVSFARPGRPRVLDHFSLTVEPATCSRWSAAAAPARARC